MRKPPAATEPRYLDLRILTQQTISARLPSIPRSWRDHSDAVNRGLIERSLPSGAVGLVLKTDLFDEAVGGGLIQALELHGKTVIAIDVSILIVARAKARQQRILALVADALVLPFRDRSFDTVASFSTLDHLATKEGTVEGLSQLHRIMRPGGRLLITLDNRANPKILLRNSMPWGLVRTSRLVPYYVGPSLSPAALVSSVRQLGFRVDKTSFILHCPRIAAVAASHLPVLRNGRQRWFQRLLAAFEHLADFPTRRLTAHFVAVSARKAC